MLKLAVERRSKFKENRLLWQSYRDMAVESRSRLEDSRLLWQFYWNMAEEEASSGGHLRRDAQVGLGEKEQAQGGQAALEDTYAEMVKLAVERRSKFKESRLLWQSYWNMAVESRSRLEHPTITNRGTCWGGHRTAGRYHRTTGRHHRGRKHR